MEPSYVAEFREISSQYIVANKEYSEEISSNGEFQQADAMAVYNEDATEVFRIEEEKKWQEDTGMKHMLPPNTLMQEANRKKQEGQHNARTKGMKHFTDVGYLGHEKQEVPRWAVNKEPLKKIIEY